MSCCSSRRSSVAAAPQLRAAALTSPTAHATSAQRLRYLGQEAVALRGPFSGRVYNLTTSQAELTPDPSDIPALLRSGLFEPV